MLPEQASGGGAVQWACGHARRAGHPLCGAAGQGALVDRPFQGESLIHSPLFPVVM
jgi:hypothetical protein